MSIFGSIVGFELFILLLFNYYYLINLLIMKKLTILLLFCALQISAQQILSEKERARVVDEILADRFNNLLPELMDRTNIDM